MRILALESSARAASCCITENGRLVAQYFQNSGLTHSKTLLEMTEKMINSLGMKVSDMDVIACAKGPGSFTGIRIGVAAAKGLAWGADKKLCGVSTLEAMAYQLADREGVVICPLMDARRGQVYNALFEAKNGEIVRLSPDRAIAIQELTDEAKTSGKAYLFVGDGAQLGAEAFKKAELDFALAPESLIMQTAYGVAAAAEKYPAEDDIEPNYLRLSQAERERLAREK